MIIKKFKLIWRELDLVCRRLPILSVPRAQLFSLNKNNREVSKALGKLHALKLKTIQR